MLSSTLSTQQTAAQRHGLRSKQERRRCAADCCQTSASSHSRQADQRNPEQPSNKSVTERNPEQPCNNSASRACREAPAAPCSCSGTKASSGSGSRAATSRGRGRRCPCPEEGYPTDARSRRKELPPSPATNNSDSTSPTYQAAARSTRTPWGLGVCLDQSTSTAPCKR